MDLSIWLCSFQVDRDPHDAVQILTSTGVAYTGMLCTYDGTDPAISMIVGSAKPRTVHIPIAHIVAIVEDV